MFIPMLGAYPDHQVGTNGFGYTEFTQNQAQILELSKNQNWVCSPILELVVESTPQFTWFFYWIQGSIPKWGWNQNWI